jgi:hypothetical protein
MSYPSQQSPWCIGLAYWSPSVTPPRLEGIRRGSERVVITIGITMAKKQTSVRKREREAAKRQKAIEKTRKNAEKRERKLIDEPPVEYVELKY